MFLGRCFKEHEMKAIRTSLIAAGLALALGSSAFAQSGTPQAHHEHSREHMRERMGERHAKQLADLKTKLKLGAGQETAWKTFTDAMQPPAMPAVRVDRAAMEKLATPERIDQMQALHAQREADMKKRGDATKAFYAGLSSEQKKVFDAESALHMKQGPGMHHHGMH
jgi:predicted secreted protein